MTWDESQHPREPAGSKSGGRFTFNELRAESMARKSAGLDPLVIGYAHGKKIKHSGRRGYGPQVEPYGLAQNDVLMPEQEKMIADMDRLEKYQNNGPLESYDTLDHTKSYALEPNAGFPPDHPLADPEARVREVNQAVAELSYSNMVGYGGALKDASMGLNTDLMKYGERRWLLPGVTYDDMLTAMQKETEGMLYKNGVSQLVLWHGTSSEFGKSTAAKGYGVFSLGDFYKGLSSWTSDPHTAAMFGQYVVRAVVPAKSIIAVPGQMPPTIAGMSAGMASLFGGSRSESEYIVRVK